MFSRPNLEESKCSIAVVPKTKMVKAYKMQCKILLPEPHAQQFFDLVLKSSLDTPCWCHMLSSCLS